MKISLIIICCLLSILPLNSESKIVSLNGSITEIIFALGSNDLLVGCDTSSIYPKKAEKCPKIGYQRTLTPEGILSLNPDIIIGTEEAGPPTTIEQLKQSGKKVFIHQSERSLKGVLNKISFVGETINKKKEALILNNKIQSSYEQFTKSLKWKTKPKILFVHSRGQGNLQVAGKDTAPHDMILLIDAINVAESINGYKPLSNEFLFTAKPDIIIIPTHSLNSMGGLKVLRNSIGIKEALDYNNIPIIDMDDLLLLGFSSRFVEGLIEFKNLVEVKYSVTSNK